MTPPSNCKSRCSRWGAGTKVYTFGLGTANGAFVPLV